MHPLPSRREALAAGAAAVGALALDARGAPTEKAFQLATFTADVTVPLGHALMGGGIAPAGKIEDELFVHGVVLLGAGKPIVLASVDWCEIRNDAYERWRSALAEAAKTTPERVLVTSIHQHDAPVADLEAERILTRHKAKGSVCDIDFHEKAVRRAARAVGAAMEKPRRVTHLGTGQAKVDRVASNRRYLGPDGKPQ